MEIVPYKGWPNNLRLANDTCEVIVTLDVGPRIISYRVLPDGINVMKNYDEMMGGTGEDEWQIRGGLRFWLGPEDLTRTYYADNHPVAHQEVSPGTYRLTPPPEKEYGIQKEVELRLAEHGSGLHITLRATNIGDEPTEFAPWGPTPMAPGGVEIIPLPKKAPHPGHVSNAKSPADYANNQVYAVWPYTDFSDPRWKFGGKYITLTQDPAKSPPKLGIAYRLGWVGYLLDGNLFVCKFGFEEGAPYPDGGVNYETFTNEDMLEIEPIAPVSVVEPGKFAELT